MSAPLPVSDRPILKLGRAKLASRVPEAMPGLRRTEGIWLGQIERDLLRPGQRVHPRHRARGGEHRPGGRDRTEPLERPAAEIAQNFHDGDLFQELERPATALESLTGPSLGWIRMTAPRPRDEPVVPCAVLKLPAEGAMIDGAVAAKPNVFALIDPDLDARLRAQDRMRMCARAAEPSPATRALPTDKGPLLIEANGNPHRSIHHRAAARGHPNRVQAADRRGAGGHRGEAGRGRHRPSPVSPALAPGRREAAVNGASPEPDAAQTLRVRGRP